VPNAKEHAPSKSASVRKTRMAPRREAIVLMRALTIPVTTRDMRSRTSCNLDKGEPDANS
jgi:hypothetical protein